MIDIDDIDIDIVVETFWVAAKEVSALSKKKSKESDWNFDELIKSVPTFVFQNIGFSIQIFGCDLNFNELNLIPTFYR